MKNNRKNKLWIHSLLLATIICFFAFISGPLQSQQTKKKALFVWGGWEGHEPKKCMDIFAPWLEEQGFEVEISDTLDSYLDPEKMKSLDLIVQVFTMSQITPQQERGLLEADRL